MTSLLIGYPDIPLRSTSTTWIIGTEDSSFPLVNASSGSRYESVRSASTVGTAQIQFDLGASVTTTAEYLFVAGANLSDSLGCQRMELVGWDGAAATGICGYDSTFQSAATLTGPRAEDFLSASGFNDALGSSIPSAAYRYFRVWIGNGASNATWDFRKIMCGMFLDLGHEPIYPLMQERRVESEFWRDSAYTFTCTWRGITDAKRTSFLDKVAATRDYQQIVLYDSGNLFLNGFKTLHCKLTDFRITPIMVNNSTLECTFEEVL